MLMCDHVDPHCEPCSCVVSAAHEAALAVCAEEGSWLPLLPVNAYGECDTAPTAILSEMTACMKLKLPLRSGMPVCCAAGAHAIALPKAAEYIFILHGNVVRTFRCGM